MDRSPQQIQAAFQALWDRVAAPTPPPALPAKQQSEADAKVARIRAQGSGLCPIVAVEPADEGRFARYFQQEAQREFIKARQFYVLVRVEWDYAALSDSIVKPLIGPLYESLAAKPNLAKVLQKELVEFKGMVDRMNQAFDYKHQIVIRDLDEHTQGKKTGGEVGLKIDVSIPPVTITPSVKGEKSQSQEDHSVGETTVARTYEMHVDPLSEQVVVNELRKFLDLLAQKHIPLYYDWLSEVRAETLSEGSPSPAAVHSPNAFPALPASRGCLGWLVFAWDAGAWLYRWLARAIFPWWKKRTAKYELLQNNPLSVNAVRPLFVLRGVKGSAFADERAINVLRALSGFDNAVFLVFTDAAIAEKLA